MKMQITELVKGLYHIWCQQRAVLPSVQPVVQVPKLKQHGHFSTNLPLLLATEFKESPIKIAQELLALFQANPWISTVQVAPPGFLNFFVHPNAHRKVLVDILNQKSQYGAQTWGEKKSILLEYVSANPTGPLHVGHGRAAAFGSALANLLRFMDFDVLEEYYINDCGRQIEILATSVWLRYVQLCTADAGKFPEKAYQGGYIMEIAKLLYFQVGENIVQDTTLPQWSGLDAEQEIDAWVSWTKTQMTDSAFESLCQHVVNTILNEIKQDLEAFGVYQKSWVSEKESVVKMQLIPTILEALDNRGVTYEKDGALWLSSTAFGDTKDRVIQRANGVYTYFASDMAYHWQKLQRAEHVINLFGADHHGYVPRLHAALSALGFERDRLEVMIIQFASLVNAGERIAMSTRSGEFISLEELRKAIGTSAARFFYLHHPPSQHIEIDLEVATSQSSENPVFYIQYAHARIHRLLEQSKSEWWSWPLSQSDALIMLETLDEKVELEMLEHLAAFPDVLKEAALQRALHRITHYLLDLAKLVHHYYAHYPILQAPEKLRPARLFLLKGAKIVLQNALSLLEIDAPQVMSDLRNSTLTLNKQDATSIV